MPITRSPLLSLRFICSFVLLAPALVTHAAGVSPSRCEQSFGKEVANSTIETCRLELTNSLTTTKRIVILETLGKAYLSQNEPDLAITTWKEASQYARPSREDAVSSETWTRLQVLIAQTLLQAEQPQKAEAHLNQTLSTVEQSIGRYSLSAGMVQDTLGTFYALQAKADEAEKAFKLSRIVYEIRMGKTHLRTMETRMNHAVGLLDMGRETEAQEQFQVLAEIINASPAYKNEPIRAEVLTFLGTLQMRGDKLLEAANNYQAAYEVRQAAFGPNDIRTSQSLNNLGVVLYRAGDLKRSEVALSKAYVIRSDALGSQDPLTLSTQKNLQAVIAAQNAAKNSPAK